MFRLTKSHSVNPKFGQYGSYGLDLNLCRLGLEATALSFVPQPVANPIRRGFNDRNLTFLVIKTKIFKS